jgi:hypothetical protein
MNTRLGTYTLVNETRYDTDDLLAVANRVEEAASRAVGGAVPKLSRVVVGAMLDRDARHAHRLDGLQPIGRSDARGPGRGGPPLELRFTSYGGTVEVQEVYDRTQLVHRSVRWLARFQFTQPTRVRLVPPGKLHLNPLQALVRAQDAVPRVPAPLVGQLAERLQDLYDAWGYRYDGRRPPDVDVSDLTVRVRPARARAR